MFSIECFFPTGRVHTMAVDCCGVACDTAEFVSGRYSARVTVRDHVSLIAVFVDGRLLRLEEHDDE